MPLLMKTDELTVGVKVHRDILHGGRRILPAGKVLNSADVDYLRQRYRGLSVYIEDPVLDNLLTFADDVRDHQVAHKAQEKLVDLLADVQDVFASRMTVRSLDCRGIRYAVDGVLDFLDRNPVMALTLAEPPPDQHYVVSHAAHVFYLSLVMGNAVRVHVMEQRKKAIHRFSGQRAPDLDLGPLALAALFMDLGMWPLKYLYEQSEPLTLEQVEQIRNHPIVSAQALPEGAPELTRLIIETHHENYDGSGYPYGLKGDEVHIFARLLRIADAYAAATSKQTYREAASPVRALWEMAWGSFSQFYDPVLLKLFASLMHPYPIGAKLQLNTGQYGVVVRYGARTPFLPEVVIAFDERGERLPQHALEGPIRLDARDDLSIVSYEGEDLSDLYARDTTIPPVTASEFTTLYESMYTGRAVRSGQS